MSSRPIQPPLPGLVVQRGSFEYTLTDVGDDTTGVISARFGESSPISFVLRRNWDSEVLSGCLHIKRLPPPGPRMRVRIQTRGLGAVYATVEKCDWYTGGNSVVLRTEAGDTIRVSPHRWTPEFMVVMNLPPIVPSTPEPTDPPVMTDPIYQRYLACAQAIWRMCEKDPLPDDDPAHTMLERLEALIRLRLIGPVTHLSPASACMTCGKPYASCDSDPRCSACVEAGDAQEHAPVPRTVVIDQRWHDGVRAAAEAVQTIVNSKTNKQTYSRLAAEECLRAVIALRREDSFQTPTTILASLGQAIDGIEQSAIDANRRAGRNAKQRDEYNECLREALLLLRRIPNSESPAGWMQQCEALYSHVRKAASDD